MGGKGKRGISGFLGPQKLRGTSRRWIHCHGQGTCRVGVGERPRNGFRNEFQTPLSRESVIKPSSDSVSPLGTSLPFLSCLPCLSLPPGGGGVGQEAQLSSRGARRRGSNHGGGGRKTDPIFPSPSPHPSSQLPAHTDLQPRRQGCN